MSAECFFAILATVVGLTLLVWIVSYCAGYKVGVKGIVDLYKNADNWISVEDELPDPKEYDWVLVNVIFNEDGSCGVPKVAELRHGEWWDSECKLSDLHETVTHWMPLPEYPKEVENNDQRKAD